MCFELCHGQVRDPLRNKKDAGPLGGAVKGPGRARLINTTREVTPGGSGARGVGRAGLLLSLVLKNLSVVSEALEEEAGAGSLQQRGQCEEGLRGRSTRAGWGQRGGPCLHGARACGRQRGSPGPGVAPSPTASLLLPRPLPLAPSCPPFRPSWSSADLGLFSANQTWLFSPPACMAQQALQNNNFLLAVISELRDRKTKAGGCWKCGGFHRRVLLTLRRSIRGLCKRGGGARHF